MINSNTLLLSAGTEQKGETVQLTCLTTFTEGAIQWMKDNLGNSLVDVVSG